MRDRRLEGPPTIPCKWRKCRVRIAYPDIYCRAHAELIARREGYRLW